MSTVLILGATSDIATATAHVFARNGFQLILTGRSQEALDTLQSDLEIRYNQKIYTASLDILNESQHQDFYKNLPFIPDVLFSAIGYMGEQEKSLSDPEEFRKVTDTNYTALASLINVFAKAFKERGHGSILVTSSVAGLRGRQSNFTYGAAKAGLNAYLSGLRNYLNASGISVTTVLPGFVATKMTRDLSLPPVLTARPEEVGKAVFKACKKGKNVIYVRWFWRYIMLIIKLIPEPIFKRLNL